jgi:16S rRNA (guanine527-N7)-methyltransferase
VKHNLNSEILFRQFLKEQFDLSNGQISKIDTYCSLIQSWSKRQNIVSKHDLDYLWQKHVLPCSFLSAYIREQQIYTVADIGSGAGLPGIIIKLLLPLISVFLIDSSHRKCLFLSETCELLGINCVIINKRVENLGREDNIPYDMIVTRGLSSLDILWQWSENLITSKGMLCVLKGGNIDQEYNALRALNLNINIVKSDKRWVSFDDSMQDKFIVSIRSTHDER